VKVIHIAGFPVRVGRFFRQRCAWCGAVLIDYDLDRTMVAVSCEVGEKAFDVAAYDVGVLVEVSGLNPVMSRVVEHVDGDDLPVGACANPYPARLELLS